MRTLVLDPRANARHDRALQAHQDAWDRMHDAKRLHGSGSPQWKRERVRVLAARIEVRDASIESRRKARWVVGRR